MSSEAAIPIVRAVVAQVVVAGKKEHTGVVRRIRRLFYLRITRCIYQ